MFLLFCGSTPAATVESYGWMAHPCRSSDVGKLSVAALPPSPLPPAKNDLGTVCSNMPSSARQLDQHDPLSRFRSEFHLPPGKVYFDGNSLGLLCRQAEAAVLKALQQWKSLAIEGWTDEEADWFHLVERIADQLCRIVQAPANSITLAGSTTLHLHQMLATLYRREDQRCGILIDGSAFPTDRYAAVSFLQSLGRDPAQCLIEVPRDSSGYLQEQDVIRALQTKVQMAVLPSVVFTSGQLLNLQQITTAARDNDVRICWDCSHSVGVVPLDLTELQPDAAIWCTYKYLNGGPGAVAAMFLHPRWHDLSPGLAGWFGCEKSRQFQMEEQLVPAEGAGRLQLGTPHILSLAALSGSLRTIEEAGIPELRRKSLQLTAFLRELIQQQFGTTGFQIATPDEDERRGGHLAIRHPRSRAISSILRQRGFVPDFREPDLIRLAPAPLYTQFADCELIIAAIREILDSDLDLTQSPAQQVT
ncbi:MAG: kynureninase [Planctomycetaceae bacterium]